MPTHHEPYDHLGRNGPLPYHHYRPFTLSIPTIPQPSLDGALDLVARQHNLATAQGLFPFQPLSILGGGMSIDTGSLCCIPVGSDRRLSFPSVFVPRLSPTHFSSLPFPLVHESNRRS